MSRVWNVRLNTDMLAHEMAALEGDAEQAAWLRGFSTGVSGRPRREGATGPWVAGYEFGLSAYEHARAKSEAQAGLANRRWSGANAHAKACANGDAKASANAHANGDANVDANGMPIEESKNRRIEESKNDESTSERAGDSQDPFQTPGQVAISDEDRWRMEQVQPWASDLKRAGAKIGPKNWTQWQGLVERRGLPAVVAALPGINPKDRWPDATETAIASLGGQSGDLASAVAHKRRRLE